MNYVTLLPEDLFNREGSGGSPTRAGPFGATRPLSPDTTRPSLGEYPYESFKDISIIGRGAIFHAGMTCRWRVLASDAGIH